MEENYRHLMSVSPYLDYLVRIVKGVSKALISTNAATLLIAHFTVLSRWTTTFLSICLIIMRCNPNTLLP